MKTIYVTRILMTERRIGLKYEKLGDRGLCM